MRATVLRNKALAKQAGRFVWLSIDTENTKNAAFLEKYPWKAVPTFEVLDPGTGNVAYSWLGAVDNKELVRRFGEGERAFRAAGPSTGAPKTADTELYDLSLAGKNEECAKRALALLPELAPGGIRANVAATGLDCALSAPETDPWRAGAIGTLESAVREAIRTPGLLDDDRAGLYASLVDARERQGDDAGARAAARRWLDWLDTQAHEAPSIEARAALDGWRVSAALAADAPQRALAPLEKSERQLPDDYNPPARLAILYRELKRYDDALAATDRALAKVYGPRKLVVLETRASIYEKKGDHAAATKTLEEALAYSGTLPEPQRPKRLIARIQKQLKGS